MTKPGNFDEYIVAFPAETQKRLVQIRATIKKAAPQAEEVISYGMPSFRLNGRLLVPLDLITNIVKFRVQENLAKVKTEPKKILLNNSI